MPRAFSYIRMSTKEQQLGDSERRQLVRARKWAADNKYELDETLKDIGVSGFRGKHRAKGALAGFLKRVRDGEIERGSVLIAERMDRLSREVVLTAFDGFRELLGLGIRLAILDLNRTLDEDALNADPQALSNVMSMITLAHMESKLKSERLLDAFDEKRVEALKGVVYTKRGPAWLELDEDTRQWVMIPDRVAIVRVMFELAAKEWGSYKIAKEFNRLGYPTFGGAQAWQSSYVSKTLRNEAVVGTWQPHREDTNGKSHKLGDPIPNYFPAVIDKSVWLTVQRITLPRNLPGAKGKHFTNLFTGIVHCAACGGPMHVFSVQKKNRNKFSYLICATKKRGLACTAERNFRLDLIEDDVLKTIDVELDRVVTDQDAKAKLRVVQDRLGEAEYRLDLATRARDTLISALDRATDATMPMIMDRLNAKAAEMTIIETEIITIKAEIEIASQSRGDMAANLKCLRESHERATDAEKFELRQRLSGLLKNFISRLDCDPVANEIRVQSGPSEYVFKGTGGLESVALPRPAEMSDFDEWLRITGYKVVEDGDRMRFSCVEGAYMFKFHYENT